MNQQQQQRAGKSNMLAWAGEVGKWEQNDLKLPDGVEFYKLEAGSHQVDLMPYLVSELATAFRAQRADPGFEHPERQYHTHRIRLPNGKTNQYVCLWETYGEQCPVCKWMNGEGTVQDPKYAKELFPTQRHLWVVNDKPGDLKNPFKVLTTNFRNRGTGFGEQLKVAIEAEVGKGNQNAAYFYDLDAGMTVQYVGVEQTFPGGKYVAVNRIDLIPRRYKYPRDVLKRTPNLDAIPVRLSYQELHAVLHGESSAAADPSGNGQHPSGDVYDQLASQAEEPARNAETAAADPAGSGAWGPEPAVDGAEYVPQQGDLVNYEYGGKRYEKVPVTAVNAGKKLVKTAAGNLMDWASLTPWTEPEPEPAADDGWDTGTAAVEDAAAAPADEWAEASTDGWADEPAPAPPPAAKGGKPATKKPAQAPPPVDDGWADEPVPQKPTPAKGGKPAAAKKK